MKANFHQILHQIRLKLLKSATPIINTPPAALPNSEKLSKFSFLKRKIQAIYKSRSNDIKFSAGIGSVLNGSWFSKKMDPIGKTTGNHPYLARTTTSLFEKSNISQQGRNHHQSKSNGNFGIQINNINHSLSPNFLALKASPKNNKSAPTENQVLSTFINFNHSTSINYL